MKVALIGGSSRSARAFLALAGSVSSPIECLSFIRRPASADDGAKSIVVADYGAVTPDMLRGCAAVINFVGAVRASSESEYFRVNADLALHLAAAARAAGATQFIHLSSLAVHGRAERLDRSTPLLPVSAYGRSKLASERLLQPLDDASFRVVLLRIPIIYGKGSPSKLGRLAALLRLVRVLPAPRPLPRRSIISDRNLGHVLVDLLRSGTGGVVFAADPQPFRLDDLVRALPFRARIVQLPPAFFAPIRWIAPALHRSLFAPMEISADCLLHPDDPPLIPTAQGLRAAFGTPGRDSG